MGACSEQTQRQLLTSQPSAVWIRPFDFQTSHPSTDGPDCLSSYVAARPRMRRGGVGLTRLCQIHTCTPQSTAKTSPEVSSVSSAGGYG